MSMILRLLKSTVMFPLKAGLWLSCLAIGAASGHYWPVVIEKAQALVGSGTEDLYDPAVQTDPRRALDALDVVGAAVDPSLRRAEARIREIQAELFWIGEKQRFIERQAYAVSGQGPTLAELASAVAEPEAKACDRERFEKLGGSAWVALETRKSALERALGEILGVEERARELRAKLEDRRLVALRLLPEGSDGAAPRPAVLFPEIEETRNDLLGALELLAKATYTLAPESVGAATSVSSASSVAVTSPR
jgi:hypothetical protein